MSDHKKSQIPVIDIEPLVINGFDRHRIAAEIAEACRDWGFFYIVGHGVDLGLQQSLEKLSARFFAQDLETKMELRMSRGGRAWRGYFPVGGELTSGKPDLKEGIYFGAELDDDHPMVKSGTPLHGKNLFPESIGNFREVVLNYMDAMTRLGHVLVAGISLSLGLDASHFDRNYTSDPLVLFRIFNYPAELDVAAVDTGFGVGEHTDYGLLTILKQDMAGGLQIKVDSQWIDATPIRNSFVCNIGDMLDRMTGGRYLSTPHRVRNLSQHNRLSFPFFFDPNFNAIVRSLELEGPVRDNRADRWDRASVHDFEGTYGDYLLNKVSKVFPQLRRDAL